MHDRRRSSRQAVALTDLVVGETIDVRLDLDTEKREVIPPADFRRVLKTTPGALDRWNSLSYTHRREHVEAIEGAKKPETRARRIEAAIRMVERIPKARH